MNKKELAKLLFQRKDIRALFESRQFDASTLKKVISEEIMREAVGGDGWKSDNSEETKAMVAKIEDLKATLNEFKVRLKDVKREFTQAKVDRDQSEMKEKAAEKKMILTDIDRLENQITRLEANLSIAYEAAGKSAPKDDDQQVAKIATAVKDAVSSAEDNMIRSASNPVQISQIAKDTSAKLGTAIRASDQVAKQTVQLNDSPKLQKWANAIASMEEPARKVIAQKLQDYIEAKQIKDTKWKEYPPEVQGMKAAFMFNPTDSGNFQLAPQFTFGGLGSFEVPAEKAVEAIKQANEKIKTSEPSEEAPQFPAGTGWKNAKSAARAKVTDSTTIESIKTSLESADAFKEFWGVKGEVDAKMDQARKLFDEDYFAERIEELKTKATENNKEEVAEEAANLAATVMGYMDYLSALGEPPQFKKDFVFPEAIPTTPQEFEKEFIEPIAPEGAKVGTSPQDYIALGKQVIQQAGDLLKGFEDDEVVERFLGWYVGGLSTNTLEESVADLGVDLVYAQKISNYDKSGDITKIIKTDIPRWNNIFTKLDELVKSGEIKVNKSDVTAEEEDTKKIAQQVIENTPKVEPDADGDLSPLATEEMDTAWTTTLDIFFGKSRERSSFMRQLLLKNQASMLYGMIDVLGQITTGGAGGEELAYTGEKTQVKQKDEPVAPPAEAEKKEEPSKTKTTTSAASESLEEQVINEIFGMFGGKDNEDKEIKFSPKSTKLMRQDLEAMVDLLRSLKTDIGQYKKYSTSSSVDPRFDGSTLKRAMDAKLKVVQQSIAHLTKVIDIEVQSQKDQLKADGAQAGQDSVDLQEASGSDRKVRIAEVEKVYNEMRRQYLKGLQVSLSKNQPDESKAGAKELKDYVMGQETFMSYFPSNIITSGGGVMTLGDAHKSMVDIIGPFIETIRDIVTITKTQKVSESNLQQAIGNLVMISNAIESMFKVPSLIDREFMKKYIEAAKQDPENQPLTNEEPSQDDEQSQVKSLGDDIIDSLKSKLGDSFNWLGEKFLNIFATDIEQTEVPEDVQEEIIEDIKEIAGWYPNLSNDQQVAVGMFGNNLIRIRGINEVSIPTLKKLGTKIQTDKKKVLQAFMDLEKSQQDIVEEIMRSDFENIVKYLKTILRIKEAVGEDSAEEFTSIIELPNQTRPVQQQSDPDDVDSSEDPFGDATDDSSDSSKKPSPPEDLDKDNSELEDVEGMDDPDEETDETGSPEDEDDIAGFNREVKSVDEFLPFPSRPTIPIAKEIQPFKTSFVRLSAENKSIPAKKANALFNKFFLLIFKQMNKDLVMERDMSTSFNIPKIKQDVKTFITSLKSDDLKLRDFDLFFENIETKELVELLSLIKKRKQQIATAIYGEKGVANQTNQGSSEKAVRGQEVTLQEALRPIIEKMLNEHYNH